ncbi:hypothetical protein VPH35_121153 [Triticum aestivum]
MPCTGWLLPPLPRCHGAARSGRVRRRPVRRPGLPPRSHSKAGEGGVDRSHMGAKRDLKRSSPSSTKTGLRWMLGWSSGRWRGHGHDLLDLDSQSIGSGTSDS